MKTLHDERDLIFSRVRLAKGSKAYAAYYKDKPYVLEDDDRVRGRHILDAFKGAADIKQRLIDICARKTDMIKALYRDLENTKRPAVDTMPTAKELKTFVLDAGAADVGFAQLNESHYYSHHGGLSTCIGIDNYGQPVERSYTHAVVFIVTMDKDAINCSPRPASMMATEEAYISMARIGAAVAKHIKTRGYESTFASEAFYPGPLVPLAYDAGLGEIGLGNHLVHPQYGSAIRLGAVYTTLKLEPTPPKPFSLGAFCKRCALCLMNCPSKSIKPHPRVVNDRTHYKLDDQTCYAMWIRSGTYCAVCLKSCPFSQGVDEVDRAKMQADPGIIDALIEKHIATHGRLPRCRMQGKA